MPEPRSDEHVYEQIRMLWDDQVAYAQSLREGRRTMSSLLLVIVGIGIFRMELFRAPEATVPTVGEGALLGIRVCFTVAIVCFLLAAYFMYTERAQIMERWSERALTELRRRVRYAMYWARASTPADLGRLRELKKPIPAPFTGRAISSLELTSEEVDDLFIKHPTDVRRDQINRLRIAYEHLAAANLRVRSRLGRGGFFVAIAYVAVFLGFLMYNWSIR